MVGMAKSFVGYGGSRSSSSPSWPHATGTPAIIEGTWGLALLLLGAICCGDGGFINLFLTCYKEYVMVLLKGSVPISFGASTSEPAAYGELVALGGITKAVKRELIATLGIILQNSKLGIPRTRFFLKVVDVSTPMGSKL